MAHHITTNWIKNLAFETEVDGFKSNLDVSPEAGGDNLGPRPKTLLLAALSGCSGMDVVSILKKMRVDGYKYIIEMDADVTDEHPKTYHTIRMKMYFEGDNLPQDKIISATEMSINKYCGVYAMLAKSAKIETYIFINQMEVWKNA